MKRIYAFLLAAFVVASFSIQASAQKISLPSPDFKKDMLGAFSPGNDMDIDNSKKDELKASNEKFLDDVLKIAGGSGSDEEKKSSLLSLGKKQSSTFSKILGEDKAKQYKKSIKKKIRPFKTKYKLATLIL
ncbi:hypothetical protein [Algoriphagus sp. PAP.12]|uniref:hypothetical protein n=1 Tax=Algoriphagus sp. PAP.12 TaxID=2996678 RepID=UPI00227BADD5|nr:hypothetical protein [Algoriphagus sp. PAP.12]